MNLTKEEAKKFEGVYYKVYLMDEMGFEVIDTVGRTTTLSEAKKIAREFAIEEIDGAVGIFEIRKIENHKVKEIIFY